MREILAEILLEILVFISAPEHLHADQMLAFQIVRIEPYAHTPREGKTSQVDIL